MKAKPSTKEQLVYFLNNQISLGTYDKKFIENLLISYISALKPVTTNQNALLDKITLRYERQLRKSEIDATEMTALAWNITPIPSLPKFTEAHINIEDDVIEIRSPFKGEFVKQLKNISQAKWDSTDKVWVLPANEKLLKKVLVVTQSNYETINYCDTTKTILNTIEEYKDSQYWNPTLIKANGNFYIAGINDSLHDAIRDIELNDTLPCLAKLVYHGVAISRSVLNDVPKTITDDELLFAVESELTLEYDCDSIVKKLLMIGADYVLMREWNSIAKNLSVALKTKLEEHNIKVDILDKGSRTNLETIKKSSLPILISGYSFTSPLESFFAKVVGIKNSTPVNIK